MGLTGPQALTPGGQWRVAVPPRCPQAPRVSRWDWNGRSTEAALYQELDSVVPHHQHHGFFQQRFKGIDCEVALGQQPLEPRIFLLQMCQQHRCSRKVETGAAPVARR